MLAKSMNSGEKVRPQDKVSKPVSKPSLQMTSPTPAENNTAAVKKTTATTTIKPGSAIPEKLRDDLIFDDESQEGKVAEKYIAALKIKMQ